MFYSQFVMMARFVPPEQFDFSRPNTWPVWRQCFVRYADVTTLSEKSGSVQVSTLIYCMGQEAETVFNAFTFANAGDAAKLSVVLEKFDSHFVPRRNVIHERAQFHQCSQRPDESVEMFLCALYEMAAYCDFPDKDNSIRDRLVVGISDRSVSEELQRKPDLTLEAAIEFARNAQLKAKLVSSNSSFQPRLMLKLTKARRRHVLAHTEVVVVDSFTSTHTPGSNIDIVLTAGTTTVENTARHPESGVISVMNMVITLHSVKTMVDPMIAEKYRK